MPTHAVAAYALRPSWRGWIHAVAAMLALPGAVLLVVLADHPMAKFAATIYGLGIVLGFGTSACYHRLAWSDRSHTILRRMDHSMIFVLIAGTYTPVCLVALPKAWGIPMLAVVWTGAITGIVLKQVAFDRFKVVQHALYPMLGWAAVVSLPALVHSLSGPRWRCCSAAACCTRSASRCWPAAAPTRGPASSATTRSGTWPRCWPVSATSP